MRRRRGYSLIEVIAVMGVSTAIMGGSIVLIATLIRADRACKQSAADVVTLARLGEQLRGDARAARSAADGPNGAILLDLGDKGTVEYRPDSGVIRRFAVAKDGSKRSEEFRRRLGPFRLIRDGDQIEVLVLNRDPRLPDQSIPVARLVAYVLGGRP